MVRFERVHFFACNPMVSSPALITTYEVDSQKGAATVNARVGSNR
jgi:hypothetical protein